MSKSTLCNIFIGVGVIVLTAGVLDFVLFWLSDGEVFVLPAIVIDGRDYSAIAAVIAGSFTIFFARFGKKYDKVLEQEIPNIVRLDEEILCEKRATWLHGKTFSDKENLTGVLVLTNQRFLFLPIGKSDVSLFGTGVDFEEHEGGHLELTIEQIKNAEVGRLRPRSVLCITDNEDVLLRFVLYTKRVTEDVVVMIQLLKNQPKETTKQATDS